MSKKEKHIDLENQRYGLFMNENSFDLDISYGEDYLANDVNFFINLYKINIIESKQNQLYGQAKSSEKSFSPPIKLNCMISVEDNTIDNYGGGEGIARDDTGNLNIGIYLNELERNDAEIDRGDIIEYNLSGERSRYYEVVSSENVNDVTSRTIGGYKPYWKKIVCVPVKEDVTPYLKGDSFR